MDVDISFQETICLEETDVWFVLIWTRPDPEVIDELADLAGVGGASKSHTEAAMNGESDFKESFKQRMALLEGLSEEVLQVC
jgi:phosphoserine phosphatase